MSTQYHVFADYGYVTECELFTTFSEAEAVSWCQQYVQDGAADSHDSVEVAYFADDGEYIDILRFTAEDIEDLQEPAWDYFSD